MLKFGLRARFPAVWDVVCSAFGMAAGLALLACGQSGSNPEHASVGAGGQGGQGGEGGEVATCGPCASHEGCVDGVCTPLKYLGVGVQTIQFQQPGGAFVYSSEASACYRELAPVNPTPSPSPCTLGSPGQMPGSPLDEPTGIVADAGPITVSGPLLGERILPPPTKPGETCFNEKYSVEALSPGELLTFSAPGGADFLPFSFSMETQAIPVITAGPLKPGEPLPIQWEGAGEEPIILLVVTMGAVQPVSIDCRVPDTGSFTVDAELTSAFAGAGGTPYVMAIRVKLTDVQDQPAVAARVQGQLGILSYLEVGYAP